MWRRFLASTTGMAVLGGLGASAPAAPITFNTALPVAQGEFVLREQFFFIKSSDDPSPANRDLEVIGGISVLAYGVTGDLALFGALPVLDKSQELDTPEGRRIERGDTGIGDAVLFGRYTVLRDDAPGRSFRIAPFVGLELPTGDDDERDGFGRLPQPLQLGFRDPRRGRPRLRRHRAVQYCLWPRELGPGVPGFLDPGLQYVTKRWVLEAIVQLPVIQDLNGDALENDYVVRAGFRVNF